MDELPFTYIISGLTVHSSVELPSAIAASSSLPPDVILHAGSVDKALPAPLRTGADWQAANDAFLLNIAGVARVLVTAGREIVFDPEPGHDPGDLTLYLLGTCFAVLLQQRGCLVLHASSVAVGDRAMLFCGASGAGKSTLAAMLCKRGYPLLNDDVCSLTPASDGQYTVRPDGRMLKLWEASLQHLDLGTPRGRAVRGQTDKFYTAPPMVDTEPRPVAGIFLLETTEEKSPAIEALSLVEAMQALQCNSYRPALVTAMDLRASYFKACAALQNDASVFRLRRPMDFNLAERTLDLLEEHWTEDSPPPSAQ